MATAQIKINGTDARFATVSIGVSVDLSNHDAGGETTYTWSIVDQPEGTGDSLSSTSVRDVAFTPTKEGSYEIQLTVNSLLVQTAVVAVLDARTHERVPAATETVEAGSSQGWALAMKRILNRTLHASVDANLVVAVSPGSIAAGTIVSLTGVGTINPGTQASFQAPGIVAALGTTAHPNKLGVLIDGVVPGSIGAGALVLVRMFGLVPASASGSPSVGTTVFLSNTATPALTPGTVSRAIGYVVAASGGSYQWVVDASPYSTIAGSATLSGTLQAQHIDVVASASPSVGPETDWAGNRGRWFSGVDVANAPTSRDFVSTGLRQDYTISDGAITNGSATLTSASDGGFTSALIGHAISGTGIPGGTTIAAVGSPTSLTMSAPATATATGVAVTITTGASQDLAYWKHRGALSPTLGIGVTPPDGSARLQVSAQDTEPAMGTLRLRRGPSQTANILTLHDSTPTDRLFVDKDFFISGSHPSVGCAMVVSADPTNQRAVLMTGSDKANFYGFSLPTAAGGLCRFSCISGGNNCFDVGTDGSLRHLSSKLGFYGATTVTRQTVVALTDNTGGTANDTLQAIPDPADSPPTADSLRDDLVANALPAIRNDLADLAAKVNAIRTTLVNLGLLQ